jgi:hypothetical protein
MSISCYEMCDLEGKLSKFIFPALVPLSSTRRQPRKMATSGEHKSFCVLDFHVNKSVVSVQRHFRTNFGTDPPSDKSVGKWYLKFQYKGCICKRKSTGRSSKEEEALERVRTSFVRSPRKSGKPRTWYPARKLYGGLYGNGLRMRSYRLQFLQALK